VSRSVTIWKHLPPLNDVTVKLETPKNSQLESILIKNSRLINFIHSLRPFDAASAEIKGYSSGWVAEDGKSKGRMTQKAEILYLLDYFLSCILFLVFVNFI
jgi:hypothetical protein